MSSPHVEELMEELYLRKEEHASHPEAGAQPDAQALAEARHDGLVTHDAAPTLTDAGFALGRSVVRRHRLAERLLHDVFAMGVDDTHSDACRFEHILLDGLDDRVCTLLGHPHTCPHGHAIPRGECCLRAERDGVQEVSPLCDGHPGRTGIVAYLSTRDTRDIQKLMAMGILPGSEIRLLRLFPSYVFEIGHSQFTVDRALAEDIYVHWK